MGLVVAAIAIEGIAIVALGILVLGSFHEVGRLDQAISRYIAAEGAPVSRLVPGDPIPLDLGAPLPPRAFLVLVSYGCGGCSQLCAKLQKVTLVEWEMLVILKGHPIDIKPEPNGHGLPDGMDDTGAFPIPDHARLFRDPDGAWLKALGVTKTPTAMAVVGGRLIEQILAPTTEWFIDLQRARRAAGRRLLKQGVVV